MEQITIDMYLATKRPPEYGERGCHVCTWYGHMGQEGCCWNDEYWQKDSFFKRQEYPDCRFMPSSSRGMPMCDNCEHCNNFIYQIKPEYLKDVANGKRIKAMYDPLEEPNIYCDHHLGSLNRRTAYKDLEQAGFGVGHYHRQHEWDICDRWEAER